jgi:hypothetical protein
MQLSVLRANGAQQIGPGHHPGNYVAYCQPPCEGGG